MDEEKKIKLLKFINDPLSKESINDLIAELEVSKYSSDEEIILAIYGYLSSKKYHYSL